MATMLPTLGYSAADTLQQYQFFFGKAPHPEKLNDYSEHHAQTFHFPDAYAGQNTKLRDTLNSLVLKQPQDWHTRIGLPFVKIEGTTVEWDEMRFDVRLLQRVPYEGTSRMATSLKRRHRERVVRRGIGLVIESDFFATEAGRSHFADQLTGIQYCVQETCNFDVIFAYLTCQNHDFRYDIAKGLRPRRNLRQALMHDVHMYGIVQKEDLGFDKAVEEARYRMSRYNVSPDLLIIPPQLGLYMSVTPEKKILYGNAGPSNQDAFDAGTPFEARAFRGLGVVSSMPYEMSEDAEAVQLLQRHSQVGEYYVMKPRFTKEQFNVMPPAKRSTCMDIKIYDEENDSFVTISYEVVRRKVLALFDGTTDGINIGIKYQEITNWDEIPAGRAFEDDWRFTPILLTRPFIEHLTLSAVVTVSGRDTGATLFGPADMQLSANTSVKTIEGHYTCHTKAVVSKPQNVFVMRDIMCAGYVAGGGAKFFEMADANAFKNSLEARLQMEPADDKTELPSLLALPITWDQASKLHQAVSLTGAGLPWEVPASGGNIDEFAKMLGVLKGGGGWHANFQAVYEALATVHDGIDAGAASGHQFLNEGSFNNHILFEGPHRCNDGVGEILVTGKGHFGPDAVPGDARWRRGESTTMQAARGVMYGSAPDRMRLF